MSRGGERALVLGLGRSGRAAVRLLVKRGAAVSAYDRDPRAIELPAGVERLGGAAPPPFDDFDLVVQSPGVPAAPHPRLVPEVDLAAGELRAPLVGVTGTNGKSTTTVLMGAMLRESGSAVAVGGNLGTPLCELCCERADWVVAELSSFQLELATRLRPRVAVLLNLAPDHLDRHGTLEAYGAAKARLAELQGPGDVLVANHDDAWAREVAARSPARVLGFSARRTLPEGAWLEGEGLVVAADAVELRVPMGALSAASRTPVENALAAAAGAAVCGATPHGIRAALEAFPGLPHRGALVCTRGGVQYVDDSKATNPSAAAASVASRGAPVVWIAGGRNKRLDLRDLAPTARGVRAVILIGEAAPELAAALADVSEVVEAGTLEKALPEAARRAQPGDVVLLAPACTSLDQFRSFEERGERFAALARALPDGAAGGAAC